MIKCAKLKCACYVREKENKGNAMTYSGRFEAFTDTESNRYVLNGSNS